jgi:hypothetical protein
MSVTQEWGGDLRLFALNLANDLEKARKEIYRDRDEVLASEVGRDDPDAPAVTPLHRGVPPKPFGSPSRADKDEIIRATHEAGEEAVRATSGERVDTDWGKRKR